MQRFIESGILEEYCLGLLSEKEQASVMQMALFHPEVREELQAIEQAIERLAFANAVEPNLGIKQKILARLGFNIGEIHTSLDKLPNISSEADYRIWLHATEHLVPGNPLEDFSMLPLKKDEFVEQALVIVKTDVPQEEHQDYLESFLILKGRCECTVGDEFYQLGAGDFIEIPLYVKHEIKILSPYVAAILQYQFV